MAQSTAARSTNWGSANLDEITPLLSNYSNSDPARCYGMLSATADTITAPDKWQAKTGAWLLEDVRLGEVSSRLANPVPSPLPAVQSTLCHDTGYALLYWSRAVCREPVSQCSI